MSETAGVGTIRSMLCIVGMHMACAEGRRLSRTHLPCTCDCHSKEKKP
jgi:hypothetical protein